MIIYLFFLILIFIIINVISMKMALEGAAKELVGSDIEFPEYDPYGFSKTASAEQMAWY